MARPAKSRSNGRNGNNGATLGFEQTLWQAADKLRNNMDAAEYKHVVLGLIFLKYISDAFEEKHAALVAQGADPEDPDEYRAEQESNPTTRRLAKMNLAIRGIDANLGSEHADSFHRDLHKVLKADFVMANPPFNMSDWGGERLRDDARWKYGVPPARDYKDVPGFCKSATTEEIAAHGHVLTPGRYVGAEAVEDDGEPFDEKMRRLVRHAWREMAQGRKLEETIRKNLKAL